MSCVIKKYVKKGVKMNKRIIIVAVATVMAFETIGCTKGNDSKVAEETKEESKETYEAEESVTYQESTTNQESETNQERSSSDGATGEKDDFWGKILGMEETTEEIQTEETTEASHIENKTKEESTTDTAYSTDKIAFYKHLYKKVFKRGYDKVSAYLESVFGKATNAINEGDTMNALNRMCEKNRFDYQDGISVLKERFNSMSIDSDIENKKVYTVGFHKNCDLNIVEDNDPSANECSDSYDRLYKKLEKKYGSPNMTFTPEQNGFTGVLWNDTACGDIWLAWGDEIFGSNEPDCILSFSRKELN